MRMRQGLVTCGICGYHEHSEESVMMKRIAIGLGLMVAAAAAVSAENWPHWRGPSHNGVSGEKGLSLKWSPTENIAWKIPMPSRTGATPIIWGDVIFLNVATEEKTGDLELWAVDRKKGEILWKRPIAGGNNMQRKQNMSSPSPVTDGRTVWVMTGVGVLKAFDFKGGELWKRDIQQDYGQFGLNWGYASSPLLHEGALYVQVLHGMKTDDPSYILKIDARSGKTIWRVERPTDAIRESPDSYTTPLLVRSGNTTEIVISGGDVVTGHDPATGKELWRARGLNPKNNPFNRIIASPVAVGNLVIACTRENPMLAIRTGGRGDVTDTHIAWTFEKGGPDVPTPVSDGTLLYIVNDRGVVHALDVKSGNVVYGPERIRPGTYSASPVLADGRIYITSEEGVTTVFAAGPKFEVLSENAVDEYVLSSVAVSNGQIFLRTDKHLYAIGDAKPARTE
jgi:outer membrane protein assembly factor BamB